MEYSFLKVCKQILNQTDSGRSARKMVVPFVRKHARKSSFQHFFALIVQINRHNCIRYFYLIRCRFLSFVTIVVFARRGRVLELGSASSANTVGHVPSLVVLFVKNAVAPIIPAVADTISVRNIYVSHQLRFLTQKSDDGSQES